MTISTQLAAEVCAAILGVQLAAIAVVLMMDLLDWIAAVCGRQRRKQQEE